MRTQGIILKKIPIKEYDELVVCYTPDGGKQAYQAKSILRSTSTQASHLDILNYADFSLVLGNGHPIITSAYCLNAFPGLKSSLSTMSAAYFLLECFDKMVFEGEADVKLWDFLHAQLGLYNKLAGSRVAWGDLISKSRRELMIIMGYDPDYPIEAVANARFRSLQFANIVLD